jgi:hypothetical protein
MDRVINMWSDVICPFCYLGYVRAEDAARELQATLRVLPNPKSSFRSPKATAFPRRTWRPRGANGGFVAPSTRLFAMTGVRRRSALALAPKLQRRAAALPVLGNPQTTLRRPP